MTEANKKTVKDLAKIGGAFGALILLIHVVPNGSIAQYILGGLMCAALVGGIVFYTGLGNPIKALYRKLFKKEDTKK